MSSESKLAIILAAGRGLRLGTEGEILPKGLIQVGGTTLIERSISFLLRSGIKRILIVTGHLAHVYVDRLSHMDEIELIFNPDFAKSGSMQSLSLCDRFVSENFILLDSDIIYEAGILQSLMNHDAENSIAISSITEAGDEVWVQGTLDRVVSLSKDRVEDGSLLLGEFIGISKVSRLMFDHLIALDSAKNPLKYSEYEQIFTTVALEVVIKPVNIGTAKWGEVDTPEQLERILRLFSHNL